MVPSIMGLDRRDPLPAGTVVVSRLPLSAMWLVGGLVEVRRRTECPMAISLHSP